MKDAVLSTGGFRCPWRLWLTCVAVSNLLLANVQKRSRILNRTYITFSCGCAGGTSLSGFVKPTLTARLLASSNRLQRSQPAYEHFAATPKMNKHFDMSSASFPHGLRHRDTGDRPSYRKERKLVAFDAIQAATRMNEDRNKSPERVRPLSFWISFVVQVCVSASVRSDFARTNAGSPRQPFSPLEVLESSLALSKKNEPVNVPRSKRRSMRSSPETPFLGSIQVMRSWRTSINKHQCTSFAILPTSQRWEIPTFPSCSTGVSFGISLKGRIRMKARASL